MMILLSLSVLIFYLIYRTTVGLSHELGYLWVSVSVFIFIVYLGKVLNHYLKDKYHNSFLLGLALYSFLNMIYVFFMYLTLDIVEHPFLIFSLVFYLVIFFLILMIVKRKNFKK